MDATINPALHQRISTTYGEPIWRMRLAAFDIEVLGLRVNRPIAGFKFKTPFCFNRSGQRTRLNVFGLLVKSFSKNL